MASALSRVAMTILLVGLDNAWGFHAKTIDRAAAAATGGILA
jgi:hypothetical protein